MPTRRFFRSNITGRFISEAQAREEEARLYTWDISTGERSVIDADEYFNPPEELSEQGPFWQQKDWERGILWDDFDPDARQDLSIFAPPEGVDAYRVFLDIEDNSDYPRKIASTGWISIDAWPPTTSMVRGVDAETFNQIRFRRG